MKPNEFWEMTMLEFQDMLEAYVEEESRLNDLENQRTAWAIAHIMNSSGNYKETIQPRDLYKPMSEVGTEEDTQQNIVERFESPEQKEEYLSNLMKKFGVEYETDGSQ